MKHLEKGINIVAALMAEQKMKNDLLHELEHPTHHHTEEQNKKLKAFAMSTSIKENWESFLGGLKKNPKFMVLLMINWVKL